MKKRNKFNTLSKFINIMQDAAKQLDRSPYDKLDEVAYTNLRTPLYYKLTLELKKNLYNTQDEE